MDTLNDLPVLLCATQQEWEAWLAEHHAGSPGAWIKLAKKNSGVATVSYDEALDSAICYGWIDTQVKAYDAACYVQKFAPRRPKSAWSKTNLAKVAQLEAAGRLKPAGLRAVERTRRDELTQSAGDMPRD